MKDVSDNSISHPDGIVKKKFALSNSTTLEQDTEYLELAKNPEKNEAKLQKIVDKAAVEAGVETDENGKPKTDAFDVK